jgi:hypothetical protein
LQYIKPIVFLLALLPLGRLIWLGSEQDLGANPIEFITRSMGTWTYGLDWVYSPQADARFVLFLLCYLAFSDLAVVGP